MSWIILALGSCFLWAFSNTIDKILVSKYSKSPYALTAAFSVVSLPVAIATLLYFGLPQASYQIIGSIVFSGFFVTLGIYYYVKALTLEEASRVVPLWNLSTIFTLILATLFLNEILSGIHYVSFVLLFIGGVMISTKKIKSVFKLSPAFYLMVISSLVFAFSDTLIKYAHSISQVNQVAALYLFSVAISGFSLFLVKSNRVLFLQAVKEHRWNKLGLLAATVVFGLIGFWMFNHAVLDGPISLINAFFWLSVVICADSC